MTDVEQELIPGGNHVPDLTDHPVEAVGESAEFVAGPIGQYWWAHWSRCQRVPIGHTLCYADRGDVLRLG